MRSGGSSRGSGHRGRLGMVSSGWMEALKLDDILQWGKERRTQSLEAIPRLKDYRMLPREAKKGG